MGNVLSKEKVDEALGGLSEWSSEGNAITRTAELANFPQAIQAVNRIAEIAENSNHHPDIDIRWRTLTFHCSTHSEGGVTQADLSLAQEIDGVLDTLAG
ncbi:MAG: 4a-hydroxytetrahydrobiopterin dehydratase [Sciscionella sp.]